VVRPFPGVDRTERKARRGDMAQFRVLLVCDRCAHLELRYVSLVASGSPDVASFAIPRGWFQRRDDVRRELILICERCDALGL
jgi:hypothetical protein